MLVIFSNVKESTIYEAIAPLLVNKPCEVAVVNNPAALAVLPAKAVLTMGPKAFEELQAEKVVPKNRTVTSFRKQVLQWNGKPTMCTYSPGIKDVDYRQYVDMLTDVNMAFRLAATGTTQAKLGDYEWVADLKPLCATITQLLKGQDKVELSIDSETVGLDPLHPDKHIVSLQFTFKPGMAQCLHFPTKKDADDFLLNIENQKDLAWLLNEPRIKTGGANFKYDLHWIYWKTGIECTNYTFDTTLVGSLLDENRSNGLDIHAKIYVPEMGGYSDEFDRTIDKSRMDLVPKDKLLAYAGGDSDAALRVKHAQLDQLLQDPQLTRFYVNILHPANRAFEIMERGGVFVDMEEYKQLEADLETSILQSIHKTKNILGGILVAKHGDDSKVGGINLTKASLIKDFMFTKAGLNLKPRMLTEKSGEASTAMEHIEMFEDVPEAQEFIKALKEFQSADKTLNTYVHGFQKHLRSDGRFHPTYYLFVGDKDEGEGGTNTGRLSARDPAFQTIPKHTYWGKRIRKVFKAPDGYLVLENDYSQGELKVIACIANEDSMIRSYLEGADLHVTTSAFGAGLSYEEMMALKISDPAKFDALRQLGKAGNFGLIYGMGVEGFMEYARANYGVALSKAQAEEFRGGFFQRYPRLVDYHQAYKAFARKHGYVRSPLGRVRHLPLINSSIGSIKSKAERQAINAPVQGALSDMMIWCIALGVQQGWHKECPPFGMIHDAKYTYIPEDNYEFYAKREIELMQNLPFHEIGWTPQLPFTADGKVGKSMGALTDLSKYKP